MPVPFAAKRFVFFFLFQEKPAKSCVPRPYESWDSFNVEKELSLVDRPDELKDNALIRASNERKKNVESARAIGAEELSAGKYY